ncbi:MAG: hypothetical protein QM572_15330 [Nocardioides sp.]|uniref:hypothetical protein n=1 Tax=Nocardioides sp. TaxID=35761 RepID=UPI0039E4F660
MTAPRIATRREQRFHDAERYSVVRALFGLGVCLSLDVLLLSATLSSLATGVRHLGPVSTGSDRAVVVLLVTFWCLPAAIVTLVSGRHLAVRVIAIRQRLRAGLGKALAALDETAAAPPEEQLPRGEAVGRILLAGLITTFVAGMDITMIGEFLASSTIGLLPSIVLAGAATLLSNVILASAFLPRTGLTDALARVTPERWRRAVPVPSLDVCVVCRDRLRHPSVLRRSWCSLRHRAKEVWEAAARRSRMVAYLSDPNASVRWIVGSALIATVGRASGVTLVALTSLVSLALACLLLIVGVRGESESVIDGALMPPTRAAMWMIASGFGLIVNGLLLVSAVNHARTAMRVVGWGYDPNMVVLLLLTCEAYAVAAVLRRRLGQGALSSSGRVAAATNLLGLAIGAAQGGWLPTYLVLLVPLVDADHRAHRQRTGSPRPA